MRGLATGIALLVALAIGIPAAADDPQGGDHTLLPWAGVLVTLDTDEQNVSAVFDTLILARTAASPFRARVQLSGPLDLGLGEPPQEEITYPTSAFAASVLLGYDGIEAWMDLDAEKDMALREALSALCETDLIERCNTVAADELVEGLLDGTRIPDTLTASEQAALDGYLAERTFRVAQRRELRNAHLPNLVRGRTLRLHDRLFFQAAFAAAIEYERVQAHEADLTAGPSAFDAYSLQAGADLSLIVAPTLQIRLRGGYELDRAVTTLPLEICETLDGAGDDTTAQSCTQGAVLAQAPQRQHQGYVRLGVTGVFGRGRIDLEPRRSDADKTLLVPGFEGRLNLEGLGSELPTMDLRLTGFLMPNRGVVRAEYGVGVDLSMALKEIGDVSAGEVLEVTPMVFVSAQLGDRGEAEQQLDDTRAELEAILAASSADDDGGEQPEADDPGDEEGKPVDTAEPTDTVTGADPDPTTTTTTPGRPAGSPIGGPADDGEERSGEQK